MENPLVVVFIHTIVIARMLEKTPTSKDELTF
jgi:hypothetical protein